MNMFIRLFWTLLVARFRTPVGPLGPCRTPFRVVPSDLDILLHVNNGVYLSMLDLARVDLMIRAGLWEKLNANGWYPVVASESIQFRKSLKLFERFEVETTALGWDDRSFYLLQRFERGGEIIASAVIRARFLRRSGGSVSPAELLELADYREEAPVLPEWVQRWREHL